MQTFRRGETGYPERLLALSDPPARVHVVGALPRLSPSVAIVGARSASESGRSFAGRLAQDLAEARVTVVSGGALGIDAAAHAGAIRGGWPTVVVLPTRISNPSPRANRGLFDRVLEANGAWLSEVEGDALLSNFRVRNRLIAALADCVVVVEAQVRSGTRHTVEAARRLGRAVGAVPWDLRDSRGRGCVEVLRRGGFAVTCSADVLRVVGARRPRAARRQETKGGRMGEPILAPTLEDAVLDAMGSSPSSVEELTRRVGCPASDLMVTLTTLELAGLLEFDAFGRISQVPSARQFVPRTQFVPRC